MKTIAAADLHFEGAWGLESHPDGSVQPWRVPVEDKELFDAGLLNMAACPSSVRIVFRTNSATCALTANRLDAFGWYDYDVRIGGKLVATTTVEPEKLKDATDLASMQLIGPETGTEHTVTFELGGDGGDQTVELWLSNVGPQTVKSLSLEDGSTYSAGDSSDHRPVWITYGSSISHSMGVDQTLHALGGIFSYGSGSAHSASRTWPATAARLAGVNIHSLGFGGQCLLDQSVARMIAAAKNVACISLKLGINVHNHGAMGVRSFGPAALGFIQTVRDAHPTTPLLIISPIYGSWREDQTFNANALSLTPPEEPNQPNMITLEQMRAELSRIVALFQSRGDVNIQYLDGREMFGEADMNAGLAPDQLHPTNDGYELMGERFAKLAFGPEGKLLPGLAAEGAKL